MPIRSFGVLLYPGAIFFEVAAAIEILGESFKLQVVTPDGADHLDASGLRIRADLSASEATNKSFQALVVPGGDPGDLIGDESIRAFFREQNNKVEALAAICAGPALLGDANVLRGRKFTHGYGPLHREILDPIFQSGIFVNENLVVDGALITAQPQAHLDFALAIAQKLNIIPVEELPFRRSKLDGSYSAQARWKRIETEVAKERA